MRVSQHTSNEPVTQPQRPRPAPCHVSHVASDCVVSRHTTMLGSLALDLSAQQSILDWLTRMALTEECLLIILPNTPLLSPLPLGEG